MTITTNRPTSFHLVASHAHRETGAGALPVLALLVALTAAGGAGFAWWTQQQAAEANEARVTALESSVAAFTRSQQNADSQLRKNAELMAAQGASIESLLSERDGLQEKLTMLDERMQVITQGPMRVDWLLADVTQYVTLAERRLSLSGDLHGAIALMEAAEQGIAAMEEPQARPLRQAVVSDLGALRAVASVAVDAEHLFARLGSLKQQVQKLEPPRLTYRTEPAPTTVEAPEPQGGWDRFWHKLGTFIKALYRFRNYDDDSINISVITDPRLRFQLQLSVVTLLDQAQLAVLRGDNGAWSLAMAEAVDRVNKYMRIDNAEGKRALAELEALKALSVRPAVPDISGSLAALNVFRQAWEKGHAMREAAAARLGHDRTPAGGRK